MQHRRRRIAKIDIGRHSAAAADRQTLAAGLGAQVEPGAEGAAGSGQDHAANIGVAVGFKQILRKRAQHPP